MSMSDHTSLEKWLVRTEKNTILGPFSREKLQQMILQGELRSPLDEICRGNSYWICLQEADELQKQLGIQLPRVALSHDDDTETETERIDLTEKDSISNEDSIVNQVQENFAKKKPFPRSVQQDTAFLFKTVFVFLILLALGIFLAMNWILRKV